MRIVIAGSSGLIGTALVAGLRQAGHEVLRLVRRRAAAPDERGWDPRHGHINDGALDGADAVVNLCGVGVGDRRWSGAYKQLIRDSRIEPTDVLARAVAERGVPVLLNASGIGCYGDTAAEVDETAPLGHGFLPTLVRDWEGATAPAADAGARVVLLRSGLVLTRAGGLMGRLLPLFKLGLGGRLGDGSQFMPWISVDDEVGAIRFAVEHDEVRGPVNVVAPEPVTNTEFTRELGAALGRPAPWVVPAFAVRAMLGEFAGEVLTGQRAVPAVLHRHGYPFLHRTLRSALESVGR